MAKFLINTFLNERTGRPIEEVWDIAIDVIKPPFQGVYDRKHMGSRADDFAYMIAGVNVFDTKEEAEMARANGPVKNVPETEFMRKFRETYEVMQQSGLTIDQMLDIVFRIDAENGENDSTQTFRKIVDSATNHVHSWMTNILENDR